MNKQDLVDSVNMLKTNELVECCKYYLQDHLNINEINSEYFIFNDSLPKEQVDKYLIALVEDKEEYYELLRFILLVGIEEDSDEVDIALRGVGHKLDLTNLDAIVAIAGMSMLFIYKMYHLYLTKGISQIDEERKIEKTEKGYNLSCRKTKLNSKVQGGISNFLSFLTSKNEIHDVDKNT